MLGVILEGAVKFFNVGGVMFGEMDFHCASVDVWFEGVVGVREWGLGEHGC